MSYLISWFKRENILEIVKQSERQKYILYLEYNLFNYWLYAELPIEYKMYFTLFFHLSCIYFKSLF